MSGGLGDVGPLRGEGLGAPVFPINYVIVPQDRKIVSYKSGLTPQLLDKVGVSV